jgi:hypothetical protein
MGETSFEELQRAEAELMLSCDAMVGWLVRL